MLRTAVTAVQNMDAGATLTVNSPFVSLNKPFMMHICIGIQ